MNEKYLNLYKQFIARKMKMRNTKWKTANLIQVVALKYHSVASSLATGNGFSTGSMSQSAMMTSFAGLSLAFVGEFSIFLTIFYKNK